MIITLIFEQVSDNNDFLSCTARENVEYFFCCAWHDADVVHAGATNTLYENSHDNIYVNIISSE
ncbi:hypothetical protein D3C86_2218850 [compost metagenome]